MKLFFTDSQPQLSSAVKHAVPLIFAVLAASAQANTPLAQEAFEARVQLAKNAELDERFRTYQAALIRRGGRHLARTMRSCRAVAPAPDQKSVVLVADIDATGKATAVEVKLDNAVGRCIATGFSSIRYPKPPAYPDRPGFPVMLKISVAR